MILAHLIISILVLWIFRRFTKTMEVKEYSEWKPFTLPVWLWGMILVIALIPILNVIGLFVFIVLNIADAKSYWASVRFKESNVIYNFIDKILNLLNKEF